MEVFSPLLRVWLLWCTTRHFTTEEESSTMQQGKNRVKLQCTLITEVLHGYCCCFASCVWRGGAWLIVSRLFFVATYYILYHVNLSHSISLFFSSNLLSFLSSLLFTTSSSERLTASCSRWERCTTWLVRYTQPY